MEVTKENEMTSTLLIVIKQEIMNRLEKGE